MDEEEVRRWGGGDNWAKEGKCGESVFKAAHTAKTDTSGLLVQKATKIQIYLALLEPGTTLFFREGSAQMLIV